jgi:SAM-dependent methyltransferase
MSRFSLLAAGRYDPAWVADFYDQTGIWWGASADDDAENARRVARVARFAGPPPRRVLDLGTATGRTAAALADAGYDVLGIDLSPLRLQYAGDIAGRPRPGALAFRLADFYTVRLDGRFDVVTYWDGFGVGGDDDQRRLLRRIAGEWLAADGVALVDVFHPAQPIRLAGTAERLAALAGVPGSVDMIRRCHYDPAHGRWIDEWEPEADPAAALAQSVRCYTPADLRLLLEGTGLGMRQAVVEDEPLSFPDDQVADGGPLLAAWSFLAVLGRAERPDRRDGPAAPEGGLSPQ